MKVYELGESHDVLTIEVNRAEERIVQAKGHCNQKASGKAMEILWRWANRKGLRVADYL